MAYLPSSDETKLTDAELYTTAQKRRPKGWTPADGVPPNGWTVSSVEVALRWAGDILIRLRDREPKPLGYFSPWPSVRRVAWEGGYLEELLRQWEQEARQLRRRPAAPSAAEIDFMDRCLEWLAFVPTTALRMIVARRMIGLSLRDVAAEQGRSHEHIRALHQRALCAIVERLEAGDDGGIPSR